MNETLQTMRMGWKLCATYQKTACGHIMHRPEPVPYREEPLRAVTATGDAYAPESEGRWSRTDKQGVRWLLFRGRIEAFDAADRQELLLRIHEMALRHDTLECCTTAQLRQLHAILSDPAGCLDAQAPDSQDAPPEPEDAL